MKLILQSQFLRNIISYTGYSILQKCIPFFIYPLLARFFTEEEVGFYVLYQSIYFLAIPIFTLSAESSITVNFYKLERQEYNKYLTNIVMAVGVYYLLCLFVLILFLKNLSSLIEFPSFWLFIAVVPVFPRFIINVLLGLFRNLDMSRKYGLITIISAVLNNMIGLSLMFLANLSWKGIIMGVLIGDFFTSILSLFYLKYFKYLNISFSFSYIIDSVKMSIPVSLHVIGSWLSNSLNRFFITTLISVAATGSFGIGATFSMMLNLVIDSINLAFSPYLFKKLACFNDSAKYSIIKVSLFFYSVIIFFAVIILIVGIYGVTYIFGDQYSSTKVFILPLILASMFSGFYKIHVNYLFFSKKTYLITSVTFSLGVLNIGLSYFMIKNYGLSGAAYSSVIIAVISYLIISYLADRQYKLNWYRTIKSLLYKCIWRE